MLNAVQPTAVALQLQTHYGSWICKTGLSNFMRRLTARRRKCWRSRKRVERRLGNGIFTQQTNAALADLVAH